MSLLSELIIPRIKLELFPFQAIVCLCDLVCLLMKAEY